MIVKKRMRVVGVGVVLVLALLVGILTTAVAEEPLLAEAGGPYESVECASIFFDASGSQNPDGGILFYRWNINGTWIDCSSNPYLEFTWFDDFSGVVILEVSDGVLATSDTANVTIFNAPPYNLSLEAPSDPIEVEATMSVILRFYDGDLRSSEPSLDTFTAVFSWGDSSSTPYSLDASEFMMIGSHEYAQAGEYDILVTLSDDDGGVSEISTHVIVKDHIVSVSIGTLIQLTEDLGVPHGIKNSLLSKLESAQASLDHGQINAAINKLEAFINAVEAQWGKKLSVEDADLLIATAQQIIEQLKDM